MGAIGGHKNNNRLAYMRKIRLLRAIYPYVSGATLFYCLFYSSGFAAKKVRRLRRWKTIPI